MNLALYESDLNVRLLVPRRHFAKLLFSVAKVLAWDFSHLRAIILLCPTLQVAT